MPVDYQKAKIYRIVNDDMPGKVYYGSTCQSLSVRMGKHREAVKNRNGSSRQMFETGKALIVLVEDFPCNSKEELHKRERFYIENNSCVNKQIPGRTQAEYYLDNKERIYIKHKQWCENNKEKMKKNKKEYGEKNKEKLANYQKEKITCECGKTVSNGHMARHRRTKYHVKHSKQIYVESLI